MKAAAKNPIPLRWHTRPDGSERALFHADLVATNVRLDQIAQRIDRIERRLDLVDAPP